MKRSAAAVLFAIVVATLGCGGGGGGGGAGDGGGDDGTGANPPQAPTGVSAVGGAEQAAVSWSSVPGATKYTVYFASQPGVTKANYSSKPDGARHPNVASTHVCTGLTNGRTYYFVVTAGNDAGESAESAEVSATALGALTQLPGAPLAPAKDSIPSLPPPTLQESDYEVTPEVAVSFRNLLLGFEDTTSVQDANAILASLNGQIVGGFPYLPAVLVQVPLSNLQEMAELVSALNANPRVAFAIMDIATPGEALPPNDPAAVPQLWLWEVPDYSAVPPPGPALQGNWGLKMIRAPQMWNLDTYVRRHKAANDVSAGVIDSGFTDFLPAGGPSSHPDFTRPNGSVILQMSTNPVAPPAVPVPVDVDDHGSMVAGIVGASWDNRLGVQGINPWLTAIHARLSRFRSSNLVSWTAALDGIVRLLETNPSVVAVNNSYGLSGRYLRSDWCDGGGANRSFNPEGVEFGAYNTDADHTDVCWVSATEALVEFAGVDTNGDGNRETWAQVVRRFGDVYFQAFNNFAAATRPNFVLVSSAGNAGQAGQVSTHNSPLNYAAAARAGRFLAVESVNHLQSASDFSDVGGSVSAPGECIRSTEADDGLGGGNYDDGDCQWSDGAHGVAGDSRFSTGSGTSFAAPHVTGLIAILWKLDENLTSDQIRTLVTAEPYTVPTTGGTRRRIDAFSAVMGIDVVRADANKTLQRALVDVDDGTVDGNQRTERDDDNQVIRTFSRVATADSRRGDGRISMADFRALRDAATQTLLTGGLLAAADVSLDGSDLHFKKDLNFDGCVGSNPANPAHPAGTVPAATNCGWAPTENTFPRYDFNGDGRVGPDAVGGASGFPLFKGQAWTDLQVLQDVWPAGDTALSEGWEAAGLSRLFPTPAGGGSGDLVFRSALPLGGSNPYDELRISMTLDGNPVTRTLLPWEDSVLWTMPVGAELPVAVEGFKAGARVGDLCTSGGSAIPALKHAEDRVVTIDECGLAQFSDAWDLDARSLWTEPPPGNVPSDHL